MFLENVIKMYINVKKMNINEMIIMQNETDYYYKWWRDLHCLISDENFKEQMYFIYFSHEIFCCDEFNFKMNKLFRCSRMQKVKSLQKLRLSSSSSHKTNYR